MSTSVSLWHSAAPKTYDEREATEALAARMNRGLIMLKQMPKQIQIPVAQELALTIARVTCAAVQLDFDNNRQVIELAQQIRIENMRVDGQARVIAAQNEMYADLVLNCFRTVVQITLGMEKMLEEARQTVRTAEGMAIVEAAFNTARDHLVALGSLLNRFEFDNVLTGGSGLPSLRG